MPTSPQICGNFPEPTNPERGQCSAYRKKETCEAPVLPVTVCEETFTIVYDPDSPTRFRAMSNVLDTECDIVTDTLGQPIFGAST